MHETEIGHTYSIKKTTKQKMIVAKAILSTAEQLDFTHNQLAVILNIDSVATLGALGLDSTSK